MGDLMIVFDTIECDCECDCDSLLEEVVRVVINKGSSSYSETIAFILDIDTVEADEDEVEEEEEDEEEGETIDRSDDATISLLLILKDLDLFALV